MTINMQGERQGMNVSVKKTAGVGGVGALGVLLGALFGPGGGTVDINDDGTALPEGVVIRVMVDDASSVNWNGEPMRREGVVFVKP